MSEVEKLEDEFDALTKFIHAAVRAKKSGRMQDAAVMLELVNSLSEDAASDLECLYNEIIIHRNPAEQAREAA